MAELRAAHPDRNLHVEIVDTLPAHADSALLRTVFQHLLQNAWEATADVAGRTHRRGSDGMRTEVTTWFVRDNGRGFDPSQAGKLFHPFQPLHRGGQRSGDRPRDRAAHRASSRR